MSGHILPPALSPGDRVAVLAPSGGHAAMFPHVFELGLERLREVFDLEPVVYPSTEWDHETLRARPEARADELEQAARDPDIDGIIAAIGGTDQVRVLPHLDPSVFVEHPTRFYGYSDNTALATLLWSHGIISYQGPMIMTELAMQGELFEYTVEYVRRAFFEDAIGEIRAPEIVTDHDLDWADPANLERTREIEDHPGHRFVGDGVATGPLFGGNLSGIAQLAMADRSLPDSDALEGAILAIETSEVIPPAWYVRFVLQSIGERGILEAVDGVVVGRAKARSHRRPADAEQRAQYRSDQREVIESTTRAYNESAPIVFDVAFGHTNPTAPLAIGATTTVDADERRIVVE